MEGTTKKSSEILGRGKCPPPLVAPLALSLPGSLTHRHNASDLCTNTHASEASVKLATNIKYAAVVTRWGENNLSGHRYT